MSSGSDIEEIFPRKASSADLDIEGEWLLVENEKKITIDVGVKSKSSSPDLLFLESKFQDATEHQRIVAVDRGRIVLRVAEFASSLERVEVGREDSQDVREALELVDVLNRRFRIDVCTMNEWFSIPSSPTKPSMIPEYQFCTTGVLAVESSGFLPVSPPSTADEMRKSLTNFNALVRSRVSRMNSFHDMQKLKPLLDSSSGKIDIAIHELERRIEIHSAAIDKSKRDLKTIRRELRHVGPTRIAVVNLIRVVHNVDEFTHLQNVFSDSTVFVSEMNKQMNLKSSVFSWSDELRMASIRPGTLSFPVALFSSPTPEWASIQNTLTEQKDPSVVADRMASEKIAYVAFSGRIAQIADRYVLAEAHTAHLENMMRRQRRELAVLQSRKSLNEAIAKQKVATIAAMAKLAAKKTSFKRRSEVTALVQFLRLLLTHEQLFEPRVKVYRLMGSHEHVTLKQKKVRMDKRSILQFSAKFRH